MAPGHGAGGSNRISSCGSMSSRRHPGVRIGHDEFGGWEASIPLQGDGERFLARGDLGQLLDDADDILAGRRPAASPD